MEDLRSDRDRLAAHNAELAGKVALFQSTVVDLQSEGSVLRSHYTVAQDTKSVTNKVRHHPLQHTPAGPWAFG